MEECNTRDHIQVKDPNLSSEIYHVEKQVEKKKTRIR